ncbi:hypothetical protein QZH41_000275 [Actinostola sp. cb2023]|nr:hypothetical protein QZH41_000275 [Actinostola sp. cb2023]
MSNESEHSESEFHYPEHISDADILEQVNDIENKLLMSEEIQTYIHGQQQPNTAPKTKYDINVFKRFLAEVGEEREVIAIAPNELDILLCNFYIKAKTTGDLEYEPDTLSSSRSIQRHLDDNNWKINILKDEVFKKSRDVLKSKRRDLRKSGKGNKPNATEALTSDDINRIFQEYGFGGHDPEVLSRTVWFFITLHFGHRARHEARQLKFGDIQLKKDQSTEEEYLEWVTERESKTRHGDENEHHRVFQPKPYATGTCDHKCPVYCYKQFVYRHPEDAKCDESPFFLAINHCRKPEDQVWFINTPMVKNTIGQILSSATKNWPFGKS